MNHFHIWISAIVFHEFKRYLLGWEEWQVCCGRLLYLTQMRYIFYHLSVNLCLFIESSSCNKLIIFILKLILLLFNSGNSLPRSLHTRMSTGIASNKAWWRAITWGSSLASYKGNISCIFELCSLLQIMSIKQLTRYL